MEQNVQPRTDRNLCCTWYEGYALGNFRIVRWRCEREQARGGVREV